MPTVTVRIESAISDIAAEQWDDLTDDGNPFLRHAFLAALERHGAVSLEYGWQPCHFTLRDTAGQLLAAMPAYLKYNSHGEFIYDWSWAAAYERAGGRYYPKLFCGIPFSPATGPRLLVAPAVSSPADLRDQLVRAALAWVARHGLSSAHWALLTPTDRDCLAKHGLCLRQDCQYHWCNGEYADFEAFLSAFTAAKRKKVRRERRRVAEQGIVFERRRGDTLTATEWALFHRFYTDTFERHYNIPVFSQAFFQDLGANMGAQIMVVLARHSGEPVAGAFNLQGPAGLYGRYWGCLADYHSLHFETCYYQGIDYAIQQGLPRFEPGAQGEHKIARGFLPTSTWSAHYIRDPGFCRAVADHCQRERDAMQMQCRALAAHSPFRPSTTE